MPDVFHLCSLGWEMYDTWSAAEEDKRSTARAKNQLKKAYLNHREYCDECTKDSTRNSDNPDHHQRTKTV